MAEEKDHSWSNPEPPEAEYSAKDVGTEDYQLLRVMTLQELNNSSMLRLLLLSLQRVLQGSTFVHEESMVFELARGARAPKRQRVRGNPRHRFAESAVGNADQEGQMPQWEEANQLQELQVWHVDRLYRFHGQAAFERVSLLSPLSFMEQNAPISARGGHISAIASFKLTDKLLFRVTAKTLERSANGALKVKDTNILEDILHNENFRQDPRSRGYLRNRRYYESICTAFATFHVLSLAHPEFAMAAKNLGNYLVASMLKGGRCRTETVTVFLDSLEVVIKGEPKNEFEENILQLPAPIRAFLYRTRRVFYKDDIDPLKNCVAAIERMTEPVIPREISHEETAQECLLLFRRELRNWLEARARDIPQWIAQTSCHRSSGSVLFPRSQGGGAREMHLMVGMYRLSRGQRSRINDVFATVPEVITFSELCDYVKPDDATKEEIFQAASWWMTEVVGKRQLLRPFLCIYPEREPKSRTFMLLDWATQQGCALFTAVLYRFLGEISYCKEAFKGMYTPSLQKAFASSDGEFTMSLDSAVSTDPLLHADALQIYEEIRPYMPDFAKLAIDATFSPMRVSGSIRRPKVTFDDIIANRSICFNTGGKFHLIEKSRPAHRTDRHMPDFYPNEVPTKIIVFERRFEINSALEEHRRVMVKSPTGTGKTVFAAAAYRSIIQFPSVANLLLFSESCRHFGIKHNICYMLGKGGIDQHGVLDEGRFSKDRKGIPYTILTTAFYVIPLARKFPKMLVVLDEAEARMEDFVMNIHETKELGCYTLLMSATPDVLSNHGGFLLELVNTNIYPIEERECTLKEMVTMVKDPEFEKSLICSFSEPHCLRLQRQLGGERNGVYTLLGKDRKGDFSHITSKARVLISTNVVRSSVTIDGLMHVFDLGLYYESVDLPTEGYPSLMLFNVPHSGKVQLRGRVGRVGPGTAWTVTEVGRKGLPTLPSLAGRPSRAARRLETTCLGDLSLELNRASCFIEYFHQNMVARVIGKNLNTFRPDCLDICEHFLGNTRILRDIALILLFEQSQLPSSIQQLKDDEDHKDLYEAYRKVDNYLKDTRNLVETLLERSLFSTEAKRIHTWLGNYPDWQENDHALTMTDAMKAIALTHWRTVCTVKRNICTGIFRDFTITNTFKQKEGFAVVMGLTMGRSAVVARGLVPITEEVFQWIRGEISQEVLIPVEDSEMEEDSLAIYTHKTVTTTKHSEQRVTTLADYVTPETFIYEPEDLEQMLDTLIESVEKTAATEISVTTRGSPMSSVASFGVLNGLSYAATLPEKHVLGRGFGDDYLGRGSKEQLLRYAERREILGLQTKWAATGIVPRDSPALALFTERFFEVNTFEEVRSVKPRGVYSLFAATHPSDVFTSSQLFPADYSDHAHALRMHHTHWYEACTNGTEADVDWSEPRRSTYARTVLSRALAQEVHPTDQLLDGKSAEKFLLHLEGALLFKHPSTRGEPRRVLDPTPPFWGKPFVPFRAASAFTDMLAAPRAFVPGFSTRDIVLDYSGIPDTLEKAARDRGIPIPQWNLNNLSPLTDLAYQVGAGHMTFKIHKHVQKMPWDE